MPTADINPPTIPVLPNRQRDRIGPALVFLCAAVLRLVDVRHYPLVTYDESIWSLQVKDFHQHGDLHWNNMISLWLSPGQFVLGLGVFQVLPATFFSLRLLNGLLGLFALLSAWRVLVKHTDRRTAWLALLMLAFSFTAVLLNRRALLETGIALMSLLAFALSSRSGKWAMAGLVVTVASLLLLKLNAIYVLPCLVVPATGEGLWRGARARLAAVFAGVCLAALSYFLVSQIDPAAFKQAFTWVAASEGVEGTSSAILKVGRFGLYPGVIAHSMSVLCSSLPDLVLYAVLGLAGAWALRRSLGRLELKSVLWLGCGVAFLIVQSFQHSNYYAALIVPAVLLLALVWRQLRERRSAWGTALIGAVIAMSMVNVARLMLGWHRARADNPLVGALDWIESLQDENATVLGPPEVAAGTPLNAFVFSKMLHPLPPGTKADVAAHARAMNTTLEGRMASSPTLADFRQFLRDKRITIVIHDQWTPGGSFLQAHPDLLPALHDADKVEQVSAWQAYEWSDAAHP